MENQLSSDNMTEDLEELFKQYIQDIGGDIQTSDTKWSPDLGVNSDPSQLGSSMAVPEDDFGSGLFQTSFDNTNYTYDPTSASSASRSTNNTELIDNLREDFRKLKQE